MGECSEVGEHNLENFVVERVVFDSVDGEREEEALEKLEVVRDLDEDGGSFCG